MKTEVMLPTLRRVQTEMELKTANGVPLLRIKRCDLAPLDDLPAGVYHCLVPQCKNTICRMEGCQRGANHKRCPKCNQPIV